MNLEQWMGVQDHLIPTPTMLTFASNYLMCNVSRHRLFNVTAQFQTLTRILLQILADYHRISGSMHTNFLRTPFLASRERLCSDHQCYLEDATTIPIYIYHCSSLKAVDTKWRDMEAEHRRRKKAPLTSEYHRLPWSCLRGNQSFIISKTFQEDRDWLHKEENCHIEGLL